MDANIPADLMIAWLVWQVVEKTADQSVAVNSGVGCPKTPYVMGGVIMSDETEFALYVPVVSKAGGYDNRPLLDGKGEVTAYISFEMAERKGKSYIDSQPEFEALSMQLSVAVLMPGDITKSLLMDEDWQS
jgi:hypothetical protein